MGLPVFILYHDPRSANAFPGEKVLDYSAPAIAADDTVEINLPGTQAGAVGGGVSGAAQILLCLKNRIGLKPCLYRNLGALGSGKIIEIQADITYNRDRRRFLIRKNCVYIHNLLAPVLQPVAMNHILNYSCCQESKAVNREITIADVAEEAGVSKSTVSRTISNPSLVNRATKEKILAIIKRSGYIPNTLAQSLAGSATKTIGVIIDELANFFFIEMAEGIDSVFSAAGYSMLLCSSRWVAERESSLVRSMISSRVDGVLLAPVSEKSEAISLFEKRALPFVLMDCIPKSKKISFVAADNYKGGRIAGDFINKHKKRRLILITGYEHQTIRNRIAGLKDTLAPSIKMVHYQQIKTMEEGYNLIPSLVEKEKIDSRPSLLFVTNDNVAIGIIKRLREMEIEVPGQVSVLGYDNIKTAALCPSPLTTIGQPIFDMGRIAAEELLEKIKDPRRPPSRRILEPALIMRESA
jgi:DNA-binding LacI/PurR family transcriptional regulator